MQGHPMIHRSIRAATSCSIIVLIVVMLLLRTGEASAGGVGKTYVGSIWEELGCGLEEEQALEAAGLRVFVGGQDGPPEWFSKEIMDIPEGCLLVMDPSERIASFVVDADPCTASADLGSRLCAGGWEKVDALTGSDEQDRIIGDASQGCRSGSTYMKKEGSCRWIAVSMQELEGETTVVMHIQHV